MCSKEKIWLSIGIIVSGGLYYYIHYYSQLPTSDMQTQTNESDIQLSDMQTQTNESDIQLVSDVQTQTNESDIQLVSVSVSPYTVISNILHKIQSEQTHILQELSKIQPDQPNKKREEPKSIFLEEDINEDLNGYDNIPYHNMKKNTNTKNVWKIF